MEQEETTVLEGQENAEGTPDVFGEGFDSDWGEPVFDDGQGGKDPVAVDFDEMPESEGEEADADQQEAEEPEGESADALPESESQGEEVSEPDRAETFTLRHLGEDREVNRDEVVTLAQKGLDYDRIREKWDGVKDDVSRLRMYEDFLGELANARGGEGDIKAKIESLIDETRIRTMIAKAEAEGRELSPAAAAAQAIRVRTEFTPAGAVPAQDTEEVRQERVRQDIARFRDAYPETKMEEIPNEVWQEVDRTGGDLLGCYQRFENRKLKDELKALKKELEGTNQQKKNKARSTGSMRSEGSGKAKDPFTDGWDAMTF